MRLVFTLSYRLWNVILWIFTSVARLVLFALRCFMLPQDRTGHPDPKALAIWAAVNVSCFIWSVQFLQAQSQLYFGLSLASLHFLIIVTALLVIAQENEVWAGYIRYDRVAGDGRVGEAKDYRPLKHGRVVKSLPLIAISTISYVAFLAVAVKGYHFYSDFLSVRYDRSPPIWQYVLTVTAQVPVIDTLVKWSGAKELMEFSGTAGTPIKLLLHILNTSIIVGTLNSYFKQKNQIRRLVEALASTKGDIPFLQLQAQRAPDEVKSSIIDMAIGHPEAHTRRRAMAVAPYLNILTFPHTVVHNLHNETVEKNKRRALAVSLEIVKNNVGKFEPAFVRLLRRKIHVQLNDRRRYHTQHVLKMLAELRAILPANTSRVPAE